MNDGDARVAIAIVIGVTLFALALLGVIAYSVNRITSEHRQEVVTCLSNHQPIGDCRDIIGRR